MDPRTGRRCHDEAGFTLPEMMMAIALLAIIAAPLALAFITSMRYIGRTDQRFTDTRGGLLSAVYFPTDVANSNAITLNDPAATACGGAAAIVSFNWSDASGGVGGLTNNEASWVYDATGKRLLRRYCANGTTTASQSVPAVSLDGAPVITCYDPGNVVDGTCGATTRWVKMVLTAAMNSPTPDSPTPTKATFTLEGTRRVK